MKRLYAVAMSAVLVACGAAGGDIGDAPSEEPDPSTSASATKPKPTKTEPTTETEADAASDAAEPAPDPDPEPDPTPDPAPWPEPDAAPPAPDAATPDAAAPDAAPPAPVCPGFERIHVAVGTCVKATNCTGYILVGGDVSLGAGAAAFPPGSEIPTNVPDPCVSNDQDACVRYKHPSSSNPKAFDVFIKPNTPATCKVTTYEFVNGVCPVSSC